MTKRMLISVDRDESRAAVVEDGQLLQLEIEPVSRNTCKGNIYRAVIARVEPSLQSAFVDFGNEKQGFLPVGEIHPKLRNGNQDKRAPIQDLLKARQEILVQVVRDEIGSKGATLSTFVSLPGRYLVLIPESDKTGISRKLSDEAREHIKELTETMKVPDGFGLIVRTAGETASKLELAKDLLYLSRQWAHIQQKFGESTGATLLYAERSLPVRFVRDYFSKDIEEVVIDDDPTLHEVGEFLQVLMPRGLSAVARYAGDVPLFARYGIEGKVDDVFARQVFLASGGSIVIDQTEALVSIDVNSGRMKEKDIEETARATNIEAAQEIARQMILRDMGGLIVIDFIDMREKKYVREVEQAIKDAFKNDKARTKIAHISEFGLLEMSRQRIKSSVNKGAFDSCPHCSGTGRLRAMDSVGMSILRRIYELVAQKRVKYVIAMVPPQTARYLLNARRSELAMVERQYHLTIEIVAVDGMPASNVVLEHLEEAPAETGSDRADRTKLLRVHQELDLVRNHLIKREEARVQLEMASARRAARVDYSEIYREVREMSGDDDVRKPPRRSAPAAVEVDANAPTVAEPKDTVEKPRGIWGWILGLFGAGKATEQTPEADAAGSESVGESSGPQGRGDRRDRRDRGPRGERERRHDKGDRGELRARREDRPVREEKRDEKRDEKREEKREEKRDEKPVRGDRPARDDKGPRDAKRDDRPPREERSRRDERPVRAEKPEVDASNVPVPGETAEEAEVRRGRRRRRRRGGRPEGEVGQVASSAVEGEDVEQDGIDTTMEGAENETEFEPMTEESQGVDATEAADTVESGETSDEDREAAAAGGESPSQRRRRRRGGRGEGRERSGTSPSETSSSDPDREAEGDGAPELPSADESETSAEASDLPHDHETEEESTVADEPGVDAAAEAPPAEESQVDARSLLQAEIERLRSEADVPPALPTADAAPAAPAGENLQPTAANRFVVDLRTR